ncbi:MAG: excinuclease ABC subunit UvrA [Candidatus Poribacteria bacterium]|nr:excinuclease ABC subunit UvrA [Candidatus Poribacteria bacterium]
MRQTVAVKGARENNLQNIEVEIPRNQLVVVTGISGSGKSSLAFDTVYAEGQRRFLESMSTYAKRFITQLKKPDVDFIDGLSPVVSIEQKTITMNPRSTVGTMTDLQDYLRMLFATIGVAHCPYCEAEIPIRSHHQILERLLALPEGSEVEIHAPVFKIYGEDYDYLFDDIRTKGCRHVRIDGIEHDISEEIELDPDLEYDIQVIVDKFFIKKDIDRQVLASLEHAMLVGEGFMRFDVKFPDDAEADAVELLEDFGCLKHGVLMAELGPHHFTFNEPTGACVTCSGLGTYLQVHPNLLVPDKSRSIAEGAFVHQAFNYDPDRWDGRTMYSLAAHYDFDLHMPFADLPEEVVDILYYGTHGEEFPILQPEGGRPVEKRHLGRKIRFDGIATRIDRHYRNYRKRGEAHSGMEEYLRKVMVERTCPDCDGAKLKRQRLLVTIESQTIHEVGELHFEELRDFLLSITDMPEKQREAGERVVKELVARINLLLGIGLDYLNLNRRSATLSGGESQRIRLSTQIGSGLMGMLYVLDEPSIGLHPKDNAKMIETLRKLRDIGNTVIVVEHDESTIRAADHIIELGPGPGVHGGHIVVQGDLETILDCTDSWTGLYMSGRREILLPEQRRDLNGKFLSITGARENNLRDIDIDIPLGVFICITGASGSGKSTLVNEILYKKLYALYHDSRTLYGAHDELEGHEHIDDVINIDQSPIGRSPRSNPATYIKFYDNIRKLFASTPLSAARGYTASRFSFNVKGGRCEECHGEGTITTQLHFMPDVEVVCPTCKGARYNEDTLDVTYNGRNISEILTMSIEEGVEFFADQRLIHHKLSVLNQLGMGYLQIGHPATILSGGEAQRIKLASELGKIKRGKHNLYILDEPTTGLHIADVQKLLDSLNRLVDTGHTVIVIEHHLDVIKTADYVIDLGPEGGHKGGEVLAQGTPEEIANAKASFTGQFLKDYLI